MKSRYARPRRRSGKNWKRTTLIAAVTTVALVGLAFAGFKILRHNSNQGMTNPHLSSQTKNPPAKEEPAKPPLVDLQPVVDEWAAKQKATYGIVVYDPANQKVIASRNPDQKFFAASLYKLFVAYLALEDFQTGAQDPNQIIEENYTRKQCVDKMIRESYSPCGEAMMADMGQEALRQRVDAMGIHNTKFAGIETTAQDCALILQNIVSKKDLNADNTAFLLDAMTVQNVKYRGGLPKGSPEATWATKVGWNEQYNYHDVGIMTLPGGRQYVVAILSQNNGSPTPIANFSATIFTALDDK